VLRAYIEHGRGVQRDNYNSSTPLSAVRQERRRRAGPAGSSVRGGGRSRATERGQRILRRAMLKLLNLLILRCGHRCGPLRHQRLDITAEFRGSRGADDRANITMRCVGAERTLLGRCGGLQAARGDESATRVDSKVPETRPSLRTRLKIYGATLGEAYRKHLPTGKNLRDAVGGSIDTPSAWVRGLELLTRARRRIHARQDRRTKRGARRRPLRGL